MRRAALCLALLTGLLSPAVSAYGHGDLEATSPEDGARVNKVPGRITITLTEPPARGAEARVRDGCKRRVSAAVSVDGSDIVVLIDSGEPGRWKVSYRAVSSVDGHQTRGSFDFQVAGKKDCSRPEPEEPEDDEVGGGENTRVANPDPPDEGGSSWFLWVGGGTVMLVAAAFFIRRSTL